MKFSTLDDWLAWQSSLNPREIELGLDRIRSVWQKLGQAEQTPLVITVGGTNGKGSSVALLESILRAAGYRTGSYTSPHLVRYNERIRIDGQPVSDEQLCAVFDLVEQARNGIPLTYFEFGTLAALLLFLDADLDAWLLEVGLGGRLDAVNMLDPDVALITGVELDHQDWLGNTREAIGFEKAGIMRTGKPVIYASDDPPDSLLQHAKSIGAKLIRFAVDYQIMQQQQVWDWTGIRRQRLALPLPALRGEHQLRNAAGVLAVLEAVENDLPVDQQAVRKGLLSVHIDGRMTIFPGDITWVLDVAHNPQAAEALKNNLKAMPVAGKTHAVFGMLKDKDAESVFRIMSEVVDDWHLVSVMDARGLDADALGERLESIAESADLKRYDKLDLALSSVTQLADAGDRVVIFGSFVLVGNAMARMQHKAV